MKVPVMVNVRPKHEVRFNVLLTEDRERPIEHWTRQLPRLLRPQGIEAYIARTGREAVDLASEHEIHVAVVDLLTPASDTRVNPRHTPGGLWLLEVLRRMPKQPPVVLVTGPTVSERQADRLLNEALRLGAFSVINRPVEIEPVLQIIRRLLDRRYAGTWPGRAPSAAPPHREPNDFRG